MGNLYIVYNIDTEGPLYETLDATFNRIQTTFGIDMEASRENMYLLQAEVCPTGYIIDEKLLKEISLFVSPKLLNYNSDWHDLDQMWEVCFSKGFRNKEIFLDVSNNGLIYNFFIMDHVGFSYSNPRRRSYGYSVIFDYYASLIKSNRSEDKIYWHCHPIHFNRDPHKAISSYNYSWQCINEIISRRLIDRDFFPCTNRPGLHTERPDIHHFLEMWIPFDYANQSMLKKEQVQQNDILAGRHGDWRRAPSDWSVYHPDHDDYQNVGNCRRVIAKCLNIGTRVRNINEAEILAAFEKAEKDGTAILSFANHDWRDIKDDLINVYTMIKKVKSKFPNVNLINSSAGEALRQVLFRDHSPDFAWDVSFINEGKSVVINLDVKKGSTFGPQPFLAIKTIEANYYHDNFDIHLPFKSFSYVFDDFTLNPKSIDVVAIGTCDCYGYPHIIKLNFNNGKIENCNFEKINPTYI